MSDTATETLAPSLALTRHGGIARLRLTRAAKGNSLSAELVQQLDAAIDTCSADGTQAALIEGDGAHFCTGFDLSDLDTETDDSLLARFVRVELMLQKWYRAPFITAALAHGKAWGAGADLFAASALRWARPDATFAFPGAAFGLVLGSGRLAALTGIGAATDWITSGRRVEANEAHQRGLVQFAPDISASAQALSQLQSMVDRLDDTTMAQIRSATQTRSAADDANDLARLVHSAARPGVKQRIAHYRAALRAAR
jgi:enoyl-CoA hydratase